MGPSAQESIALLSDDFALRKMRGSKKRQFPFSGMVFLLKSIDFGSPKDFTKKSILFWAVSPVKAVDFVLGTVSPFTKMLYRL